MRAKGVEYVAVKRDNMVRSDNERTYHRILSRIEKIIETRFSQPEEFGAKLIRAISRRSQNNLIHTILQHISND
jgi:aspartate/tyrosine/aromatic aminotransferase